MNYRAFVRASLLVGLALCLPAFATAQTIASLPVADGERRAGSILDLPARLDVSETPLASALSELSRQSGVTVAFSPSLVTDTQGLVSCNCAAVSVGDALDRLLAGTSFSHSEFKGQIIVFRPAEPAAPGVAGQGVQYAMLAGPPGFMERLRTPAASGARQPTGVNTASAPQQVGAIQGRVAAAETQQPIRWARVQIDGSRREALTDGEGRFRIERVPVGTHTVVASMIGYGAQSREVRVAAAGEVASVDFSLEVSVLPLDAIVVTAVGEQRRVELGHSVGRVQADSIAREAPVTRLTDLIGARVPGVQILANTGLTGESPRVRIRGTNSFTLSRDPLVYIDGVRVESSTGLDWAPYGFMSGRFNDMNPNDIESIEIVKGPSAATLYGTDAANGVILIRTKRGTPGRARWHVYAEAGALRPSGSFENLDGYYSWGTNVATGQPQRCVLQQLAVGACAQDSITTFNPLTDAETSPIGTGQRSQLGLQVSGGTPDLTYFLAFDRELEQGYLRMPALELERIRAERGGAEIPDWQRRPNELDRWSARARLGANIGQNADVQVTTSIVSSDTRIPGNDIFNAAVLGSGNPAINDGWWQATNRPGEIFSVRSQEDVWRHTSSVAATWRPLSWLRTRATVGTDVSNVFFDALQRPNEGPPAGRMGRRLNRRGQVSHYTTDLGASATWGLMPDVTSRTSVGVQYNRRNELTTVASATDLPPGAETVVGAGSPVGQESRLESAVAGAYIEQMFGLNDRLFLTAAARADGGSSFGRNFQTAVYPKGGVSWLVSDEAFFPSVPLLESLRLRVAYGQSGVQPGSTDAMDRITRFTAIVDGVGTPGARLSRLGNPDLRPERQRELEAGFDIDIAAGRLNLEATYYNRLSTDALVSESVVPSAGIYSRWVNVGSVRNWGYEVGLNSRIVESRALSWDVSMNGSINHNRLEKLGIEGVESLGNPLLGMHREGFPLFGRWGRPILSYEDRNGNGIIEPGDVIVGDTIEYIGPSTPPRQLTAGTVLGFFDGRLSVSSQFDYRGDFVVFHGAAVQQCLFQACRAVNDPTAPLSDQARMVGFQFAGAGWTGFMENTSFVRWRELAATYQLPSELAGRIGASALSLTLSGRNLHLWTDFTGLDPESNAQTSIPQLSDGAIGNPTAPQTRYWILRANLSF